MKFSLSQAFRSLMVWILRKHFQDVCVLVSIIPVHLGSCMHISPCLVWPAVKMDKHTDYGPLKALWMCTFPSALSVFVSMLLPDTHHMALVVLPIVFLCWHKNSSLLYTFLCLPFQVMPLNSKLHESRELSVLFTSAYPVQCSAWHTVDVSERVEWMDCWMIRWLRAPCWEKQGIRNHCITRPLHGASTW